MKKRKIHTNMTEMKKNKRNKYEIWSDHANLNIEYEAYFFDIIEKIEDGTIFSFLRICDGDYHNIFLKQSCDNQVELNTILKVSKSLLELLNLKNSQLKKSIKSNLLVGLQFGTQYDQIFNEYINQYPFVKNDGYSSALFSWAYATDKMIYLLKALNKSNQPIIMVGPSHLSELNSKFKISSHIKTPIQNTWLHQETIENDLESEITFYVNNNKNPIVLYSCSVSAKLAIAKFYNQFEKEITQIDIGSNFDPYVSKKSRGWHVDENNRDGHDLFKYYNMNHNLGAKVKYRDFELSTWCYDIPQRSKEFIKNNIKDGSNIVEIGVHGGSTLLKVFDLTEEINCKIYGIDCWEDITEVGINGIDNSFWTRGSLDEFLCLHKKNRLNLENILKTYDVENKCQLIRGFSNDINIISKFEDESVDYLYIDGDHSYYGCYQDLKFWYPKVKRGGLIVGDDANLPAITKALNHFCKKESLKFIKEDSKFFIYKP